MTGARRPTLSLGFSPCPNDTFMFWGLVHGEVEDPGVDFSVEMADIEELNRRAVAGGDRALLDVTKLSVPALARVTDRYRVLGAGAALGRGCGPLVVARRGDDDAAASTSALGGRRVAIPGRNTTAFWLLRSFAAADGVAFEPVELRFDQILEAVAAGDVDAGLIIHESRFTYPDHGLVCVHDLGERWERDTGLPLPLGLIAAKRSLGDARLEAIERALGASVELAFAAPERPRPWIREHSQEIDDAVCDRHIALYVNADSIALSADGRRAIDEMLARGRDAAALPAGPSPW